MQSKDLKKRRRRKKTNHFTTIIGLIGITAMIMIVGNVYRMFRGSEIGDRLISTDVGTLRRNHTAVCRRI